MDPGVHRATVWWGTFATALALAAVGIFGYLIVSGGLEWYRTPLSDARDVAGMDVGEYVRVDGTIALNATEDVVARQVTVEKGPWTVEEREWAVPYFYLEDDHGDAVEVLCTQVQTTRPGPHDGAYHRGDGACVGGHVTLDAAGRKALRADFVGKHPLDAGARFVGYYYAAMAASGVLFVLLLIGRLFLEPRRRPGRGWRSA